jgi:hypothetical protein
MRGLALAMLWLDLACVPHPAPPPTPPAHGDYEDCTGESLPISADVCLGYFTDDGYPCVRCPGAYACVDGLVYCVSGGDCHDARCAIRQSARTR